jgi:hypothetical protein
MYVVWDWPHRLTADRGVGMAQPLVTPGNNGSNASTAVNSIVTSAFAQRAMYSMLVIAWSMQQLWPACSATAYEFGDACKTPRSAYGVVVWVSSMLTVSPSLRTRSPRARPATVRLSAWPLLLWSQTCALMCISTMFAAALTILSQRCMTLLR